MLARAAAFGWKYSNRHVDACYPSLWSCPPFLFQAMVRARGLPERKEKKAQLSQRLMQSILEKSMAGSTHTKMGMQELPASGAAASKQQGQGQELPAAGAAASKQQRQGQGQELPASGPAASKQQGQGQELPASGPAASKQQGQGQELPASEAAASKQQGQGQGQPGGAVGKGEDEAATRPKLQEERGLCSSGKEAKVRVGRLGWQGPVDA